MSTREKKKTTNKLGWRISVISTPENTYFLIKLQFLIFLNFKDLRKHFFSNNNKCESTIASLCCKIQCLFCITI